MGRSAIVKYFGHKGTQAEPLGATLAEAQKYAKVFGYRRCNKCREFVVKVNGICPVCEAQARDKAFIESLKG